MMMRRPRRRLRDQSINRLIPNMCTVLALCAGLTAIRFAVDQRWDAAVIAMVAAGIFDGLDGRIARLLGGSTKFGAELDSLSDVISFGVAPAVTLYLWSLKGASTLGWTVALIFAVCCALRLARFNSKLDEVDPMPWAGQFFTGVPAPAGAGLAILPIMLSFELGDAVFRHPAVVAPVMLAVAGLMVSRLPINSFKKVKVPHHLIVPMLLGVGILAGLLVSATWITLILIGIAYIINIPLSIRTHARLKRSHEEQLAAQAAAAPAAPPPLAPPESKP
jgi:CDP-diacylglycerol--serine O-phosphatidyltransferase